MSQNRRFIRQNLSGLTRQFILANPVVLFLVAESPRPAATTGIVIGDIHISDRRQLKIPVDSPKMLPFGVALLSLFQQTPTRMVTDQQVRRLFMLIHQEPTLAMATAKAGMDEKTARKYRRLGKLPSEVKTPHTWRTRKDPFADVWDEVRRKLKINPGLQAKSLFLDLQRRYPGRFADGQLRTLQRRVKHWRAVEGPPKEVFFPPCCTPGERCQSDFTSMNALGITIQRQTFDHLVYHFVLPYFPGSGKTHLLCAIGQELIYQGRRVLFRPCSLLVQELLLTKQELSLPRLLKRLSKYEALIIDDIGYVVVPEEASKRLFSLDY